MAGQLTTDTGERIGGNSVASGSNTTAPTLATAGPTPVANASADEPSAKPADHVAEISQPPETVPDARFDCDATRCAIRHPSGRIVVHTADAAAARAACGFAALIVIDDATAELSCPNPAVAIVTRRDLARHGSAAIHFAAPGLKPEIRYAVAEPYRPWLGNANSHALRAACRLTSESRRWRSRRRPTCQKVPTGPPANRLSNVG